jgi:hypothetical protein
MSEITLAIREERIRRMLKKREVPLMLLRDWIADRHWRPHGTEGRNRCIFHILDTVRRVRAYNDKIANLRGML